MLCLLLVACWNLALADLTNHSPDNNTHSEEHSTVTATSSVDPWSPVVGDTEGAPAATRSSGLQGRRAAVSLVENIRRQLMRDNYDYISDENDDDLLTKTTKHSKTSSKEQTTVLITSQAAVTQTKLETIPQRVTTTRRSTAQKNKPKEPVVQVARVSSPVKNIKGNMKSQSGNKSPRLRSFDMELVRSGTPMPKNVKIELDVSKKDLLFYIDDSHLRRNNPDPGNSPLIKRRKNDPIDFERSIKRDQNAEGSHNNITLLGNKDDTVQRHVNDDRKSVQFKSTPGAEKYTATSRRDKKTQNKSGKGPKQQQIDIDIKAKQSQNILMVTERGRYLEELDEKIMQIENQVEKKNVSEKNLNNDQQNITQKQQANISKESSQNSTEELEPYSNDEKNMKTDNNLNYRRSYKHRRSRKKTTKSTRTDDDSYDTKSSDDDDSEHSTEEVQHKRYKNNRHNKKRKKQVQIPRSRKQKPHKKSQKKKVKVTTQSYEESVEHVQNLRKSKRGGRKTIMKKRTHISRKSNENDIEASNKSKKPSTVGKANYKTTKSVTVQPTRPSSLRCTHTVHQHDDTQETKKTVEIENVNTKKLNINSGGDNTTPVSVTSEKNEIKEQNKDDFQDYIDSMDNEDLNDLNGRRMNIKSNETESSEINKQNYQCNSLDGCTPDGLQETSPTAKYKLLKVKTKGGSRRSRTGERQFIQERGPNGVVLIAVDGQPFPQFRLPRSRRQYMFEEVDKLPPLIEHISTKP